MQIIDEPLSMGEGEKLRRWLDQPEFLIFVRVVESLAFRKECEAAERVIKGTPAAEGAASASIFEAQKTRHVLEVMKEFKTKKVFHLTKAVPTTTK